MYRSLEGTPTVDQETRTIRYVFSDSAVARDGNTIKASGWELKNFRANPVFLWAHDSSQLPIGRVVKIGVEGDKLVGEVEYLTAELYPFADTVYQLVRGKFLNATSVRWNTIEYRYSQDKSRPGGIDFIRQELLEVSQVPVPCDPGALAEARRAGINTKPIADWAARALSSRQFTPNVRRRIETIQHQARIAEPKGRRAADLQTAADREREARSILQSVDSMLTHHNSEMARLEKDQLESATLEGRIRQAKRLKAQHTY